MTEPSARAVAPAGRATTTFHRVVNRFGAIDAVLHSAGPRRSATVVVYTHPREQSSLTEYPCPDLAARGIDVFAFNNRFTNSPAGTDMATIFEAFALDVGAAVQHVRALGYRHVLLLGWSAGGPVMAFYQHVAERGDAALSPHALDRFPGFRDPHGRELRLPPADGLVLRSVTIGTAASFLIRLDGAVIDEVTGATDPGLDIYRAENGWNPLTGAATYAPDFLRRVYRAQALRMNRLVDETLTRLEDIGRGRGRFADDDFLVIQRTRANPTTVDLALAARGSREAPVYPDGALDIPVSTRPVNHEYRQNGDAAGAAVHKLRSLLSYRLVRVDPDRFDPLATSPEASGIDSRTTNTSTTAALARVAVPVLVIQGTGDESNSVKIPTAEQNAASCGGPDTTLAFVQGGMHNMTPVDARFGDTRAIAADVMAGWIRARYPA